MPFPVTLPIGFDFCGDITFVTHTAPNKAVAADQVFDPAAGAGDSHGSYGYIVPGVLTGDRDPTVSNKSLASLHYNNPASSSKFKVVLPAAGNLDIRLAVGDPSNPQTSACFLKIWDNNSGGTPILLATISTPTNTL